LILDLVERLTKVLRRFGGAEVLSKPRGLGDRGYRRRGLAVVRLALVCFQVGAQELHLDLDLRGQSRATGGGHQFDTNETRLDSGECARFAGERSGCRVNG
jgi:hypothetical protein